MKTQNFVIHVSKGYEERQRYIDTIMERAGIDFEYVLDGDIADITPEVMDILKPSESMRSDMPAMSCLRKHMLAYQRIIDRGLDGAFIFEDDVVLRDNFLPVARQSLEELPDNSPALISYEDTRLRFVPGSQRRKGQVLYTGTCDRFAGAYFVNVQGAKTIVDEILKNGVSMPIDLLHNHLRQQGKLKYYWTHPCPASQGSFVGLFASSINAAQRGRAVIWRLQRLYKRLLYRLR